MFSYPVAQTSLNGVTGKPSDATAEEGESLFGKMVVGLCTAVEIATPEATPLGDRE